MESDGNVKLYAGDGALTLPDLGPGASLLETVSQAMLVSVGALAPRLPLPHVSPWAACMS